MQSEVLLWRILNVYVVSINQSLTQITFFSYSLKKVWWILHLIWVRVVCVCVCVCVRACLRSFVRMYVCVSWHNQRITFFIFVSYRGHLHEAWRNRQPRISDSCNGYLWQGMIFYHRYIWSPVWNMSRSHLLARTDSQVDYRTTPKVDLTVGWLTLISLLMCIEFLKRNQYNQTSSRPDASKCDPLLLLCFKSNPLIPRDQYRHLCKQCRSRCDGS